MVARRAGCLRRQQGVPVILKKQHCSSGQLVRMYMCSVEFPVGAGLPERTKRPPPPTKHLRHARHACVCTLAPAPVINLTRPQALTEAGEGAYDVTLLDANPNPGGLSAGWRTAGGRAVEAGKEGAAEFGCADAHPSTNVSQTTFGSAGGRAFAKYSAVSETTYVQTFAYVLHNRLPVVQK